MSILDEYRQQQSGGTTQRRPSILQEHVTANGMDGLNKNYVDYALRNGGGFGATPGGIYLDDDGSQYVKPYYPKAEEPKQTVSVFEKLKSLFKRKDTRDTEGLSAPQRIKYNRLLDELDRLNESASYVSTVEASDELEAQRRNIVSQLEEIDRAAGRPERYYDHADRIGGVFRGWAQRTGSSLANLPGNILDIGNELHDASSAEERAIADNPYAGWATDDLTRQNMQSDEVNRGQIAQNEQEVERLYDISDELHEKYQAEDAKTKYGTSAIGEFAIDAAQTGMDIAADTAFSLLTGGAGLLSMGARVYGSETQQARLEGDDAVTAAAKGIKATAIEIASELLGGPFEKVYGKTLGAAIREKNIPIISNVVNKLRDNGVIRWVLEAGSEGIEEGVSDVLNIVFDHLFRWDDGKGNILDDIRADKEQILYDMMLGAFVGGFGASANVMSGAFNHEAAEEGVRQAIEQHETSGAAVPPADATADMSTDVHDNNVGDKSAPVEEVIQRLGVTEEAAGIIRSDFDLGTVDAETFARGVEEAYKYGQLGASLEDMQQNSSFATALSETQRNHAYQLGRIASNLPSVEQEYTTGDIEAAQSITAPMSIDTVAADYGENADLVREIFSQNPDMDVAEFSTAFEAAYNIGHSMQPESSLDTVASVQGLSTSQRKAAWDMGRRASGARAAKQFSSLPAAKSGGKKLNRKGTVRGDGVKLADLKKAFNDRQNTAYRLLTRYAEATGVNIVLYSSKTNAAGEYAFDQGRFQWADDTIFIDINSGLYSVSDVDSLGKYTMLRTFAHEFTHFVEKWSPVEYNNFREFVFQTLTDKGLNVNDLIETKLAEDKSGKLNYEQASREVIADAMVDILPDSDIVQRLAAEHETLYKKLITKLREFVGRLRLHYRNTSTLPGKEAQALKEQIAGNLKYMDSIVQLWTKAGQSAVRNYKAATGSEPAAPVKKPLQTASKPQKAQSAAQADPYNKIADGLRASNSFEIGGLRYSVRLVPGAKKYTGAIERFSQNSDRYPITNARANIYSSGVKNTRAEVVDELVAVARASNLLGKTKASKGATDTFSTGNIFNEKRIKEAANNAAASEIIRKMPSEPKAEAKVSQGAIPGNTPSIKTANRILTEHLRAGKPLSSKELYAIADDAFGGTQAEGAYNRKDAYDAMELAVNRYLLEVMAEYNDGTAANAIEGLKKAQSILGLLPTQNVRTQEMEQFQQFSTPPSIAYLAAWSANISNADSVLEPSAGIGGLAAYAKAWGAEVTVNELSKRRLEVLKAMGFDHVFNENAEHIDNVLPDSITPSVVIMNPPFSSTAGRTATNKTSNAERHINQALERLSDGGRLVAILGRGMADANYSRYWNSLRESYNIRANLSIDGDNYKKYGTTFDVQLVVIDKTGAQGAAQTLTGNFKDLADIPKVLEGIRNDRNSESKRNSAVADVQRASVPVPEREQPVSVPVDTAGNISDGSMGISGGDIEPVKRRTRKSGSSDAQRKGAAGIQDAPAPVRPAEQSERDTRHSQQAPESEVRAGTRETDNLPSGDVGSKRSEQRRGSDTEPARSGQVEEGRSSQRNDDGVYADYVAPALPVNGSTAHPAVLVESAAMSAVEMPPATYVPHLPAKVVANSLSTEQMVSVVYAGQAHEQQLPTGERKGFFIGDGTGVGKGRQISGIILDNFEQGRKKAVWVSMNASLYPDAVRDWTETTGRSKDEVHDFSKVKLQNPIDFKDGILYTTYDTLRTAKGAHSRLDQIVKWLGKDFDGVIAFDEAHNMGNLLGRKGKFGKGKGSAKAAAAVELQSRLPNARIVYVSATAATDVEGLAFASRLGLWGRGTAFPDVNSFVSSIGSSGLAAMELVIRDMKAMGVYVARSISYNGVSYDTVQHNLDDTQTYIYNTMSSAWQKTMDNVVSSLESTGGKYNSQARQNALGQYYSAMQRFYNQVLTSMSMPSVIADMRKELDAGRSCVLQIVNTNQAEADRQIADIKASGGSLDDMDLTPRGTLLAYLDNCYPVIQYEEYVDDEGVTRSRPVLDSKGQPVIDKGAVRKRDALIAEVEQMSIPDGPLEMLFNAFGTENVSEITGRTRRVVPRKQEDGTIARVEESRGKNHTAADVEAFQEGKKRILIFSDAGGTGKSYHASRTAKNQQQRVHYVLQPGWIASKAVQGFGRTHRSNQVSAPIYKLVTTNIKGQKRFTSTIARRLDQLGALTKGQRDTGSGMFGARDNLETDLARDSLREFYRRLGKNQIEGIDGKRTIKRLGLESKFTDEFGAFKLDETVARDISTFLNRILALEVDEQNAAFDAFISIYETQMEEAMRAGTLDTGMQNVKADKIEIIDDKVIKKQEDTGAETHYVQAKVYTKPKLITTVAQAENMRTGFMGIYRTKDGDVRAVYRIADKTTEWGAIQKQYRLSSPNISKYSIWKDATFEKNAESIPRGEWQSEWDKELAKVPEYNEEVKHMLTGTLLPIWDALPTEGNTKVQRLVADDGKAYLGRVINQDQIDSVLRRFNLNRTKETFTAQSLADAAIKKGVRFNLSYNRAQIQRSRVSGEWRLEYKQPQNQWSIRRQYPDMLMERISYADRYFIPLNPQGMAMLDKLLAENPVATTSEADMDDVQFSQRRKAEKYTISRGMSDQERYEVLKDKKIALRAKTDMSALRDVELKIGQSTDIADALTPTMRRNLFRAIGREFGVFKQYFSQDFDLQFSFGTRNMRHSLNKQGKNYPDFAKMLTCFDDVIDNAVGIEVHNRNDEGYKTDETLEAVYVLVSAFEDGDRVVPVKLEIKEFSDKENTLYVAISLESIKRDEVVAQAGVVSDVATNARSSEIILSDFFAKINPTDTSFLKYVPVQFFEETETVNDFSQDSTRARAMSNREVLEYAAENMDEAALTPAQREALSTFKERLSRLEDLQEQRREAGQQYKEQMFTKGGKRSEAPETKNRMDILDNKIKALENSIVSLEDKDVLRQVLVEARKVVERHERTQGEKVLKAYREQRNESAARKKYRARVQAEVARLHDMLMRPASKNVLKRVPATIQKTVADFISGIDFTSKRQLSGGAATKADAEYVKRMSAMRDAIKGNIELLGAYSGYADLPPTFMERFQAHIDHVNELVHEHSGEYVVNMMDAAELRELAHTLTDLRRYIQDMNKFHNNSVYQHSYEAAEDTIEHTKDFKRKRSRKGKVPNFWNNFLQWQYMRPALAFERFGKGGESIFHEFRQGQATQAFLAKKLVAFAESTYTAKEVEQWSKDTITVEIGGEPVTIPVTAAMSFYCLNRRPQARTHIYGDGIRIATYEKDKYSYQDEGHTINEDDARNIIGALTERQIEVAEALQKFMSEECAEWGNYVTLKRFATEVFGEAFYFPINSDGRYLAETGEESPANASLYALLNMGFTKELKENASNRIVLYNIFDVFANHTASMTQYRSFALPILDALKWFNYKTDDASVRDALASAFGMPAESRPGSGNKGYAEQFVLNLLKAYNGTAGRGDVYDSAAIRGLHLYNRAQVAYNFRVIIQQPMSITRAAMILSPKKIMSGLKKSATQMNALAEEMEKYSGIAAWKSLGFYDTNISRGLTALIKQESDWMENITDVGMWGAEKADRFTWAAIWSAAKDTVKRSDYTSEAEYFEAVTTLFEEVIYKTQVVDSILTKAEFLRAQSFGARMLGSFQSEPSATISLLVDAGAKYSDDIAAGMSRSEAWTKNRDKIGKALTVYIVGQTILAAVQGVADAERDDDDYQTFIEKWLEAFKGNVVDELMPFGKIPILSEFYDLTKDALSKLGFDTYGNPVSSGWMQYAQYLSKSLEIFADLSKGETKYTWYGGLYNLLRGVSGLTGVPIATASREVIALWNTVVGSFKPEWKLKTYDAGTKASIKYAYLDGDLTADEAIAHLIEQGAADNEDAAYWTVKGWETGESSKYSSVKAAVAARDYAAYQAAMQELTSHGVEEKQAYSEVKRAIKDAFFDDNADPKITRDLLTTYVGMSTSEAQQTVDSWKFSRDNPNIDWTDAQISTYTSDIKPTGITVQTYDTYLKQRKVCTGTDSDGDGKTDSGSVKSQVLIIIDALPLTVEQKDALYYANGWAASKINEAPWHNNWNWTYPYT